MFERFTEKAIQVILLAQSESRRGGHNVVGSEQILIGLILEDSSWAATVLKELGLTLSSVRAEVEKATQPSPALLSPCRWEEIAG